MPRGTAISSARSGALARLLVLADLALQGVLQPDLFDQLDLGLEEVDVLLGVLEDVLDDLAADVILGRLAMRHCRDQRSACRAFKLEVGVEAFRYRLADAELAEVLQVGQAFEEQ